MKLAFWREVLASARSHRVTSLLVTVLVAIMVSTVLLTTGRAVAAQQDILANIDSAGTRSIIVKADASAGITSDVIDRIGALNGVSWVGAFGPAQDVTNSLTGGMKVPIRTIWSHDLAALGLGLAGSSASGLGVATAWGSPLALDQLGMIDRVGSVSNSAGFEATIMGQIRAPEFLSSMEPLLLSPADQPGIVGTLVVIAERPALVSAVAAAVQSVLDATDPTKVSISTSERLAALRGLIDQQLSGFNVSLTIAVFVLTGLIIAVLLSAVVAMQRRDFGRRRALGASQRLIVTLILAQTAVLASLGVVIGIIATSVLLTVQGYALPGWSFTLALAALAVAIPSLAAVLPGILASRRDPATELRVP